MENEILNLSNVIFKKYPQSMPKADTFKTHTTITAESIRKGICKVNMK